MKYGFKPLGKNTEIGITDLDNLPHSPQIFCLGIQLPQQLEEMVEGCTRILCIDSTHGTNQYKYHLLNLVIPDEYGIGYPVAHVLTNYIDKVMAKCPNLVVNAVMTDGDEALGNAIRKVFGNVRHLLCSWQVRNNWQKNLHRKLPEGRNEDVFNSMLETFLSSYYVSASAFIKYFRGNYCENSETWAFCYCNFPHARTDTNMFEESFHNKLKTHLSRKVNRRLDDPYANVRSHAILVGKK
ncbi:hypothetical protein J437_LFUL017136 [Ladona fulva]|uniref:MULE transposase domain-containing protein n=1 Tax=Ladona fulva TaxID=123851 RepID=A0A8K0PCW1_LADFU|nr:hypothetical protein J437_LFUL017136 [Ladona fulva]